MKPHSFISSRKLPVYLMVLFTILLSLNSHQIFADNEMRKLSDIEMSSLFGRYTPNNAQVAYFGIEMLTEWKTAQGEQIQAGLSARFTNEGSHPSFTFSPIITMVNVPVESPTGQKSSASTINPDHSTTSGVFQSTGIAGHKNIGSNDLAITWLSEPPDISNTGYKHPHSGPLQVTSTGGIQADVKFSSTGAQVKIDLPDIGYAEQSLGSSGISQSIHITGDAQQVHNTMALSILPSTIKPLRENKNILRQHIINLKGLN